MLAHGVLARAVRSLIHFRRAAPLFSHFLRRWWRVLVPAATCPCRYADGSAPRPSPPLWLRNERRIRFDEGPHLYYWDGDGRWIVSATTWMKRYWEGFDARKVVDAHYARWQRTRHPKYYGMSKGEIVASWGSNDAAEKGTRMHAMIERHLLGLPLEDGWDTRCPEFACYQRFLEDHRRECPHLSFFATEYPLFDRRLRIAGTIDCLLLNVATGGVVIVDWKRASKSISPGARAWRNGLSTGPFRDLPDNNFWHYSSQLNLYRVILERWYRVKVEGMFLVRIHPEAADSEQGERGYHKQEVPKMPLEMYEAFVTAYRVGPSSFPCGGPVRPRSRPPPAVSRTLVSLI